MMPFGYTARIGAIQKPGVASWESWPRLLYLVDHDHDIFPAGRKESADAGSVVG